MAKETIMLINKLKQYFPVGKKNGERLYVKAVDDVSLEIKKGEILGLVGESGSGKSTIAYSTIGMYRPTGGQIIFDGCDLADNNGIRPMKVKKDLQIVFQDPRSSLNMQQSVKDIIGLPLKVHGICKTKKEIEARVEEILGLVELPANYMYKSPISMGGGERQMISIARALATDPKFILLDEPTSALDVSIQANLINTLIRLQKEKDLTYLFITHDLSLIRNIATRVAILYLGRVAEIAPADEFFNNPCHPYTKMLLSSIPVISEEEEKLKPDKIESNGEIPSPVNIPSGCSFHLRCPFKKDICVKEDPVMHTIGPNHQVRCHLFEEMKKG